MNKIILIFCILFLFFLPIIMYLIILGGNITKSKEEKEREDEEQIQYLKNYKNRTK